MPRSCARRATDRVIERNAAVQLCYVEVDEPDMHKPLGDLDRLKAVLEKDWGWKDLLIAPHFNLLPQVQGILRKGKLGGHRRDPPATWKSRARFIIGALARA